MMFSKYLLITIVFVDVKFQKKTRNPVEQISLKAQRPTMELLKALGFSKTKGLLKF